MEKRNINIAAVIVLTLFVSCSNYSDLELSGLKGEVNSFIEKHYTVEKNNNEWGKGDFKRGGDYKLIFDKEGNALESQSLDSKSNPILKWIYKYENEKLIKLLEYNEESNHVYTYIVVKNSKNRFILDKYDISETEKLYSSKSYYSSGKIEKKEIDYIDGYSTLIEYEYNDQGLLESYRMSRDGQNDAVNRYEYLTFDDQGNWLTRLLFEGFEINVPNDYTEREIIYY